MTDEPDIIEKLEQELIKIEEDTVPSISDKAIKEILSIFGKLDQDMLPMIEVFSYALENIEDNRVKSVAIVRFLKFYGLMGNTDILETRQKLFIIDKNSSKLAKKPFLKDKDKICINNILKDLGLPT